MGFNNAVMDYESIVIGLLSSIIASFNFLILMFMMRPKVVISDLIARTIYDEKKAFVVKIINRSWWKVYDIHAELVYLKFENVTGGQNLSLKHLTLTKDHLWSTNRFSRWQRDTNAEYAALYVCLDDLDALWSNDSMIEFRVIAKHSFSGFIRVIKRRYYRARSTIRDGSFKFGNSLEID